MSTTETKALARTGLGLLVLMIVLGLVFIVAGQYLQVICEDIDGSTYTAGTCAIQSESFNQTAKVRDAIKLLVTFLTIIVLIIVVKILVEGAKSLETGQ